ncbi:MAG: hypothetical protein GY737_11815 [Desulfobacteraceae bacterium]|nr:hypothetical protein [Desulfobacteraceae bacterium]
MNCGCKHPWQRIFFTDRKETGHPAASYRAGVVTVRRRWFMMLPAEKLKVTGISRPALLRALAVHLLQVLVRKKVPSAR